MQCRLCWVEHDKLRKHCVNLIQIPEIVAIFVSEESGQKSSSQCWSAIKQFRFLQAIVEHVTLHVRRRAGKEQFQNLRVVRFQDNSPLAHGTRLLRVESNGIRCDPKPQIPFHPPIPGRLFRLVISIAQNLRDAADPMHALTMLRQSEEFVEPTIINGVDGSEYRETGRWLQNMRDRSSDAPVISGR